MTLTADFMNRSPQRSDPCDLRPSPRQMMVRGQQMGGMQGGRPTGPAGMQVMGGLRQQGPPNVTVQTPAGQGLMGGPQLWQGQQMAQQQQGMPGELGDWAEGGECTRYACGGRICKCGLQWPQARLTALGLAAFEPIYHSIENRNASGEIKAKAASTFQNDWHFREPLLFDSFFIKFSGVFFMRCREVHDS